jgi:DNA-binding MarR family transcriptional regulator
VPVRKQLDLPFDPIMRAAQIWEHRFGDSRAMAAATSIMRPQPHGLTFARYEALVLLTFSRSGALPMRLIGQRLMVHPTSVTNIINRLERQGLVIRRPNPSDGRGTLAEITADGRALAERATKDLMAAEFGVGGYDTAQLDDIFGLLRGLRVAAGDFAETEPAAPVQPEPAAPVQPEPAAPVQPEPAAPVQPSSAAPG